MSDFETLSECSDCGAVAEWTYCSNHQDKDYVCYKVECVACDWVEKDCDTTEHLEIKIEGVSK
jgi:hypothetical protein